MSLTRLSQPQIGLYQNFFFLLRYFKIYLQVRLAEENGAAGLLFYPDPEDFTTMGAPGYPDSWDLPRTGVPRGTITNVKGDPLTPSLPSTGWYFYTGSLKYYQDTGGQ